ncbi:MAG TPA: hypothetical protein VGI81_18890 [Tepidisphaeraceae bacterium]
MFILAILIGLGSLACWILVLVKIFQAGQIGLGILGIICPLFTFIYGWIKADQFGIRQIMIIWSVLVLANIVVSVAMPHQTIVIHH